MRCPPETVHSGSTRRAGELERENGTLRQCCIQWRTASLRINATLNLYAMLEGAVLRQVPRRRVLRVITLLDDEGQV